MASYIMVAILASYIMIAILANQNKFSVTKLIVYVKNKKHNNILIQ